MVSFLGLFALNWGKGGAEAPRESCSSLSPGKTYQTQNHCQSRNNDSLTLPSVATGPQPLRVSPGLIRSPIWDS